MASKTEGSSFIETRYLKFGTCPEQEQVGWDLK
jgi:hypothetical protein